MTPFPVLLGCSGWDYAEWVGRFYPSRGPTDRLQHYAQVFPIVEINSSFYHLPTSRTVESWARRTPRGFRFTAKVPQEITHDRRLEGVEVPLRAMEQVFRPLVRAGKLSAFLVQLPPSLAFHAPTVRRFYASLPREVPVAVEFREESWLCGESFDLLREFSFAHTVVDEPKLPVNLTVTAPFAYVRWHGHGDPLWYDYRYRPEELVPWVERVRALEREAPLILGFFNNHFRADAPANALEMGELLGLRPPPWVQRLTAPTLPPPSGPTRVPPPGTPGPVHDDAAGSGGPVGRPGRT